MEAFMGDVVKLRAESEKITINVGYVDLGQIDLLVSEGYYSNRSDLIRTAIRNQLASHAGEVKKSIIRQTLELGIRRYTRRDLEEVKARGDRLRIKVLGLASIDDDVPPTLALQTIDSITVLGVLQASEKVKAALAERIE
jgi:Arc/MetJ-type ribon-helix-helix transcriptional regulator